MIGHVFRNSGAICLAAAPSKDFAGDYSVVARVENGYAVASIDLGRMPQPNSWVSGTYFIDGGGDASDRQQAAADFCVTTGIDDVEAIAKQIEKAEIHFADTIAASFAALAG